MTEVMPHLRRVNPIAGMMIDVETWRTAHDYHRDYARLHHRALHGLGIVTGLDVVVGKSVNALLIQPGVAIDPAGNFVIVDQEQVYRLSSRARGMVYIVLRYRDAPAEPGAAEAATQTRVLESFLIEERTLPPADNDVELARIDFDPQRAAVQPAADQNHPGLNEVDARFRVRVGAAGESVAAPAPTNGVAPPSMLADDRRRLDELDRHLHQLADQLHAAPAPDQADAAQMTQLHERLEEIARQVALLWQRPVAATASASEAGADSAVANGITDLQVENLRQRFEGLAHGVADLGEQVKALGRQRDEAAGLHQVLADQVGALARQGEAAAPEFAQVRDRLDTLMPEVERLASSVEPLERQIQQLADRAAPTSVDAWPSQAAPPPRELRLAIGRTSTPGWEQHREGLRLLGRELAATVEPMARVLNEVQLSDLTQVELLYLTGHAALALDETEIQGIARVLESGAVVLAEGCAAGPSGEAGAREFAFSFIELAQRLGRRLTRVERSHRLFEARYVFADPPAGARPARVLEADGVIYSDADYGCAWQGGAPPQPLPRSTIRDALEFGVNMAIYRQARG
jgi:hypothetical protein